MNSPENLKSYQDPLFAGLKSERSKEPSSRVDQETKRPKYSILAVLFAATTVVILAYFIYQAQQQIGILSQDLELSREQLGNVTEDLNKSQQEIVTLNEGLESSQAKIQGQSRQITQYRGLVENLQNEQEEQTLKIATLNVSKADQAEVNQIKDDTSQLRSDTTILRTRMEEANSEISQLDQRAAQNQEQIQQNRSGLASVRSSTEQNAGEIAEIRTSLEKEYYNFELHEKGGYMKVFDVSLSLKDTNVRKNQFDLYLLAGGKVLQKKDHSINEPILFYVEGQKKPYEVVVTRVDEKLVVGYLGVPKG